MERRTGKHLLIEARRIIEAVAAHVRHNETHPGVRELAQYLIDNDDCRVPERLNQPHFFPSHPDYREIMASVRDGAIFRLWGRSKVVYAMDELLLDYLSNSRITAIPTQILHNLPHANPFILLPQPDPADPQTSYYRAHIGLPWGAFVFGRYNDAQQLCSTHDDKREDLGLMFVGFIDTEEGATLQAIRCTIPLRQEQLTVEDAVTQTIANFQFSDDLGENDHTKFEAWLRRYVGQILNSVLYVCTDQPDTEIYRPASTQGGRTKKHRKQRRSKPGDIDTLVQLGFRLGPALHEARQQWEQRQSQEPTATGRKVRPHQKAGHYRTYWTGKGRQVPKLKWIAPFWVNQDLLGTDGPQDVVVHPVRKQS